jgi:hypothetical protein
VQVLQKACRWKWTRGSPRILPFAVLGVLSRVQRSCTRYSFVQIVQLCSPVLHFITFSGSVEAEQYGCTEFCSTSVCVDCVWPDLVGCDALSTIEQRPNGIEQASVRANASRCSSIPCWSGTPCTWDCSHPYNLGNNLSSGRAWEDELQARRRKTFENPHDIKKRKMKERGLFKCVCSVIERC